MDLALVLLVFVVIPALAAAYLLENTDRGRRLIDRLDARVDPPVRYFDPFADEPGDWRS
jgi:hypothetical protein